MAQGRFENKVVVTGAASGIGRAAVLRLLDEGASVGAADLNEDSVSKGSTGEQPVIRAANDA
jgi:NAD(P)-dependent dehydrogenase (short-subunit alcohol dehydrogenase family)